MSVDNDVDFITWAITDGQKYSKPLGYVPLPSSVVDLDKHTLNSRPLAENQFPHNIFLLYS